jgi:hypothetical protein
MPYLESKITKGMEKIYGNLPLEFKMEMVLVFMHICDIVDRFEKVQPSNMHSKVSKEFQRRVNKSMSIIKLNLAYNQPAHIKSYTRVTKA